MSTVSYLNVWQVRRFLEQSLEEMTHSWSHGIKYELKVACPCDDLQEAEPVAPRKFHLLPLEDCLTRETVTCDNQMLIETERFKTWFQDTATEEDASEGML